MIIYEQLSGSVTFRNRTAVLLSDSNVISASVKRQACSGDKFDTGGVYAAQLTLKCAVPGTNSFILRGAKISLSSKYGSENAFSPVGTFWITDAKKIAGDIYQITALDAVCWLDSSSFAASYEDASGQSRIFDSVAKYMESQGEGTSLENWCFDLTAIVNSLLERMTGQSNVLTWLAYNGSVNGVYTNEYALGSGNALTFFLSTEAGSGDSDCPRDLFRHLAKLAGGFIFVNESGYLTLGQFSMPEFGTAQIDDSCIQQDSCEIADYKLQTVVITAQSDIGNGIYNSASSTAINDYSVLTPIRFQLDSNPFLDGFAAAYCRGDGQQIYENLGVIIDGVWNFAHRFRYAGNVQDVIQTAEIRPFSCIAHSEQRFHLGQKIGITYQGIYHESTITSVTWNFRGGWQLSCAGADTRSMADALRANRTDKTLSETRTRYRKYVDAVHGHGITDNTVMTQAEYDALENPDENTLYVISEENGT